MYASLPLRATAATAPAIFLSAANSLRNAVAARKRAESRPTDSSTARGRSSRAPPESERSAVNATIAAAVVAFISIPEPQHHIRDRTVIERLRAVMIGIPESKIHEVKAP